MGSAVLGNACQANLIGAGNFISLGTVFNSSSWSTTEANAKTKLQSAGVVSAYGHLASSTSSVTTVYRQNGADSGITVTSVTAAWNEDSTHSATIAAGDLCCANLSANPSTGQVTSMRAVFSATTDHVAYWVANSPAGTSLGAAGTFFYAPARGTGAKETTEADAQISVKVAGTIDRLQVYFSAVGASSFDQPPLSRLNGVNGNLTCTPTAATLAEDTTHSDTVAVDDLYCVEIGTHSSGTYTGQTIGLRFTNTVSTKADIFWKAASGGLARGASGTANYCPPIGGILTSTTEATNKFRMGFACIMSMQRTRVGANTYGADGTQTSRKNGADATQITTLTAGVAALFVDATHSDTLAAADDFCSKIVGGTSGSATLQWGGYLVEDTAVANVLSAQAVM